MEWIHNKTEVKHFVKINSKFQYFFQIKFEQNKYPEIDHQNKHSQWQISATLCIFKHCIRAQKFHGHSDVSLCHLS